MKDLDPRVTEILRYLNETKIRATYGAVAAIIGGIAQSVGGRLGARRPFASWVVSAKDGMPSGFTAKMMHPDLTKSSAIIRTGAELKRHMATWRARGKP